MPRPKRPESPFLLLSVPYRHLVPLMAPADFIERERGLKGAAVIWRLGTGELADNMRIARRRPPGVVLILVLPPASSLTAETDLLHVIGRCRPNGHCSAPRGCRSGRHEVSRSPAASRPPGRVHGVSGVEGTARRPGDTRHHSPHGEVGDAPHHDRQPVSDDLPVAPRAGSPLRVEGAAGALPLAAVLPDSACGPPAPELLAEPALRRLWPGLSRRLRSEQPDEPARRNQALDCPAVSGMGVADGVLAAKREGERSAGARLASGWSRGRIAPPISCSSRPGPTNEEVASSTVGLHVTPASVQKNVRMAIGNGTCRWPPRRYPLIISL